MTHTYMVALLPNADNPNITVGECPMFDFWIEAANYFNEVLHNFYNTQVTFPKSNEPFRKAVDGAVLELWKIQRAEA